MRKTWILIILLAMSTLAFGQAFSAGGGLSLGELVLSLHRWGNADTDMVANTSYPSLAVHGFVDLRYLLVDAGLGYGWFELIDGWSNGIYSIGGGFSRTFLWLDGSIVAKYPFPVGAFTLFPFAGIEYMYDLVALNETGADNISYYKGTLNGLFIKAGLGADIPLKKGSFFRSILCVAYKPYREEIQTTIVESLKASGYSVTYTSWFFRASALVGWRL